MIILLIFKIVFPKMARKKALPKILRSESNLKSIHPKNKVKNKTDRAE